jgi:hypothetical protein
VISLARVAINSIIGCVTPLGGNSNIQKYKPHINSQWGKTLPLKVWLHWFMFSHLYRREVEEGCLNISFGHVHHCLYQCHATPHHMISARVEEHFVERKIFCSCRICFDINSSILCFRTSIEFLYNRYQRFPRWWYSHFTIDICGSHAAFLTLVGHQMAPRWLLNT